MVKVPFIVVGGRRQKVSGGNSMPFYSCDAVALVMSRKHDALDDYFESEIDKVVEDSLSDPDPLVERILKEAWYRPMPSRQYLARENPPKKALDTLNPARRYDGFIRRHASDLGTGYRF